MKAKRILAVLLALCMLVMAMPFGAFTAVAASDTLAAERLTAGSNLKDSVSQSTLLAKCGGSTKSPSDGEGPANLFDGALTNKLGIFRNGSDPVVVTWQMTAATKVTVYTMATANDSPERDPRSWTLYGSNNGADYTAISTVTDYTAPAERNVYFDDDFVVADPAEYLYYKLEITAFKALPTGGYPQFAELVLSGADTSDILQVADLIDAIPAETDPGFAAAVTAAETAYNALGQYKQSLVYNVGKLSAAIKARNIALVPEEYKAAVLSVVNLIEALDKTITYRSDKKIDPARAAYDALLPAAREYVYNYSVLQQAEADYQTLMDNNFVSVSGWNTDKLTSTPWLQTASAEEQAATWQAFADEIKYQYAREHYDIGRSGAVTAGEYMGNLQVGSDSPDCDNVGNPWGHANRYVAFVIAPFSGMAFSTTGYFGAQFDYTVPISDVITYNGKVYLQNWSGVRFYDETPLVKDTTVPMSSRDFYPGNTGISDESSNTFRYAYAAYNQANKWNDKTLGVSLSNAAWAGDVLYQQFEGPDGYTYLVNSRERINATTSTSEASMRENQAFAIVGDMSDAFTALGSDNASRFARTGAALGNQFADSEGNTRQDFEKLSIILDKSTGAATVLDGDPAITGFSHPDIENLITDGSRLFLLVKSGTELSALAPAFTIPATASVDKASGSAQDFTNPVTYTVTAQNGNTRTYTVEAVSEDSATGEDRAAANSVAALISELPNKIYRNHRETVESVIHAFDTLTGIQRLLVSNQSRLLEVKEQLLEITSDPIRVTCVGDSITEGDGSSDWNRYSYPGQLQALLGPDYFVMNAGVCGTNAIDTAGYPYVSTDKYPKGLASNPDVVIMMLGTNDARGGLWNSTSIDAPALFKQDYTKLINEYQALDSNPKIYLALPMTCYSDSTRQTNNLGGTIPILREIAEEQNIEIIDMNAFTANHSDWFVDGLHPGDVGYGYIAAEFKTYIDAYVSPFTDVSLSGIKLDDTALEGFDPATADYTVQLDSFDEIPEISATGGSDDYTIRVTDATAENPVATIEVTSAKFNYGITYTVTFTLSVPVTLGDVNGDGKVNATDIMLIRKLMLTGDQPTPAQLAAGDLDGDGTFKAIDIMKLRKLMLQQA